ncbi:uncharacterized protein GIQ15_06390 [Arthroderma uncinatum]|uniref:uncharacterized protein n=1 Tax=Arthroderma uncinatum TaxID=74035 RepID=UPI00144AECAD|nr:uncharacterized protein GIQ15_06390 [Arthroderma uncinatum]KAF3479414.1 hypothetical protein GIQ15_06390 [Arthroderma uncinatum]
MHVAPLASNDIDISYETVPFNGSFYGDSVYRKFVGPEVDQAWDDLGVHHRSIALPEDAGEKYGIKKGQVKRAREQGGGYLVNVEVFHHLHCLDMLRQVSYYSYDHYMKKGEGAFKNTEDILKLHAEHCLDMLRQQIMCTADTGVFGQWFVRGIGPFVDFNTKHKCKNFEQIRDWAKKAQVPVGFNKVEERPGDIVLKVIP